jgi:hypothetical protein
VIRERTRFVVRSGERFGGALRGFVVRSVVRFVVRFVAFPIVSTSGRDNRRGPMRAPSLTDHRAGGQITETPMFHDGKR